MVNFLFNNVFPLDSKIIDTESVIKPLQNLKVVQKFTFKYKLNIS